MKKYIIDDELTELDNLICMLPMGYTESLKKIINKIKSKQPIEEIASGLVDDLCHDFGVWATKRWIPNEKYKVFVYKE